MNATLHLTWVNITDLMFLKAPSHPGIIQYSDATIKFANLSSFLLIVGGERDADGGAARPASIMVGKTLHCHGRLWETPTV